MAWTNVDYILRPSVVTIVLILGLSLVSNIFVSESALAKLGFVAPFAISLIYYERYLREADTTRVQGVFVFGFFLVVIVVYLAFFWSGFGRIDIGSYLLIPLLLLNYYRDVGIRTWQVVVLSPLLLYIAQASRYTSVDDSEKYFLGSAGVHLTFTDDLWGGDTHIEFGGLAAWFEQWLLLLANWVPRVLWSSKPVGLGASSVDDWIGRDGFGEGYSISLGFLGEQYYLLGEQFWLGLVLVFITLLAIRVSVQKLCRGYVVPLIMFDVNLMSYFWGGGGTFGSRSFFFLVPAVGFVLLMDRYGGKSFKVYYY